MIVVNRSRRRPSQLSSASFLSLSLQVLSKDNLCAGYLLRKPPEKKTNARKVHFHPLLYLAEAIHLGHAFRKKV
jgi:hypothetical protein